MRCRIAGVITLFGLGLFFFSCSSSTQQSLIWIGGKHVDNASIDQNPLMMLPSHPSVVASMDAKKFFESDLGVQLKDMMERLVPFKPSEGFDPSKSVDTIYGGVYFSEGTDACFVIQGHFDTTMISNTVDNKANLGIVKTEYANNTYYTFNNGGFSILTSQTILGGTETCMRRALDRLRYGNLKTSIPNWIVDLLQTKGAAFAMATDASALPLSTLPKDIPLIENLEKGQMVGNFQKPGILIAGTPGLEAVFFNCCSGFEDLRPSWTFKIKTHLCNFHQKWT